MALVAVANPLPELLPSEPPKRGGGYVELGDHVVVCNRFGFGLEVGLDVTTFFAVVLTVRAVLEVEGDLSMAIVAGRVVVAFVVGFDCDWEARSKLYNEDILNCLILIYFRMKTAKHYVSRYTAVVVSSS